MSLFRRILAPTDFSEPSVEALALAAKMAGAHAAELHLLHVVNPQIYYTELPEVMLPPLEDFTEEMITAARRRLAETAEAMGGDVRPECHVEETPARAADAICDYAARGGVDLIVIASHGRRGLMHVLMGSTAERVVQHAPCPVLVTRPTREGGGE